MFPLRSLPVHVASDGGGEVLFNRFCQTGQAVRLSASLRVCVSVCLSDWLTGCLSVCPSVLLAGNAGPGPGYGTAQASDCRSPQADRRAKLLQPGQGRLRQVDDDDIQERGARARADQALRCRCFDRAKDSRSKKRKQGGNDANETVKERVAGGGDVDERGREKKKGRVRVRESERERER